MPSFILVLFAVFVCGPAFAFERGLLYRGYQKSDGFRDGYSRIDSEYASDYLTYSATLKQRVDESAAGRFYHFDVGSISSKRFLFNNSLVWGHSLSSDLDLKLMYFDQDDYLVRQSYFIAAMGYRVKPWYPIEPFSEFQGQKSDIDFGLVQHFDISGQRLSLSVSFPDAMQNERAEDDIRFNQGPRSIGIQWTGAGFGADFLQVGARVDEAVQVETDSNFQTERKRLAQALGAWKVAPGSVLRAAFEWRYRARSDNEKAQSAEDQFNFEQMHEAQIEWDMSLPYRWGVFVKNFRLETELGSVNLQNYLPYVWYKSSQAKWAGADSFELGLEGTLHWGDGPEDLRAGNSCEQCLQTRANYVLNYQFKGGAVLRLLFTIDLEELGGGETWEGGAGQFTMSF